MFRRLLIALFILANLTSQVSVAYACGMMGGEMKVLKHCCCHGMKMKAAESEEADGAKDCCEEIVQISDEISDQSAAVKFDSKLPTIDPQLAQVLLPALLGILVPVQTSEVAWSDQDSPPFYGSDLYLQTQRLRL